MDVNIYSSDPKKSLALVGNHENTEVGNFLRDYLDLDLEPVTKELQSKANSFKMFSGDGSEQSWMGASILDEPRLEDHYHGDFKRSLDCGHLH